MSFLKSVSLNFSLCKVSRKNKKYIYDKKSFIWIFSAWSSKKLLPNLKLTPSNLFHCKVWCRTKILKFENKNTKFAYFWAVVWKAIVIFEVLKFCLVPKFGAKIKILKFWSKNAWFGYLWTGILKKLLSYLKSTTSNLSTSKISWKNENA